MCFSAKNDVKWVKSQESVKMGKFVSNALKVDGCDFKKFVIKNDWMMRRIRGIIKEGRGKVVIRSRRRVRRIVKRSRGEIMISRGRTRCRRTGGRG